MVEVLPAPAPAPTGAGDGPPLLVIGIDFGVAWALSHNPRDIGVISSWETLSSCNSESEKVPSCIEYDGHGRVTGWGFDRATKGCFQLQWFKLLLSADAQRDAGEKVQEAQRILDGLNKLVVDAVADYLKCLWAHTFAILEKRLNRAMLDTLLFRVVLTVPAAWDHRAQDLMREAAERAGIRAPRAPGPTTLQLVAEPEAAALATFSDAGLQWRPDLKPEDTFVVCDAGGGTVDLISYQIKSMNPPQLRMCVIATCGFCGTITLDEKFERLMRTLMGASAYDKIKPEVKAKILNDCWEHSIKRNFREGGPGEWEVLVPKYKPGLMSRKIDEVVLKVGHLEAIFQPACGEIASLVRDQVRQARSVTSKVPKQAILLVGGFGDNKYLFQQLEKHFKGIPVQQPHKAWTAVSRGAVLRGLTEGVDETITNFISNYHYGVAFDIFCDVEQVYKARDQMKWYLHRGESVEKSESVSHHWYKRIVMVSQLRSVHLDIYISDSNDAPSHKDSRVKHLCTIYPHLDDSIFEKLPVVNTGSSTSIPVKNIASTSYRKLHLTLDMRVSAGNLEWLVYWENKQKGSVEIKVNYVE
ncbi:hypothetical protein FGG08_005573 [Glutinoglossum americanum]|uniref:Actin-like ATPase domain-containing protein n=1 Tax=Glutinoglossum americanum TaxID=1670608 RepID=A0A9P8L2S5_9PEZI|nr:hypothetical protein FGG08_005573 [Glutinoglossum americanum]